MVFRTITRRGLACALLFTLIFPGIGIAMFKEGFVPDKTQHKSVNELIVRFKTPVSASENSQILSVISSKSSSLSNLIRKFGVTEIIKAKDLNNDASVSSVTNNSALISGICKLTLSNLNGMDIESVAREFSADSNIYYAEPNYRFQICVAPNDPYLSRQWGLTRIGATGCWDARVGDPNIVIAVVDTGVDYNHNDLSTNIWVNVDEIPGNGIDDDLNGFIDDIKGWDFVSVPQSWAWTGEDAGPEDADPMDFVGHGTHVSGIAAGRTNNSLGTAGMTWNCKIMPVRAGYISYDGYGYLEYFDAGRAIIYAADNGANIINMSWGGLYDSDYIRDAIEYAHGKGVFLVASAGNVMTEFASDPYYPAAYPQVMAVSATDEDDMISIWSWIVFSNYGSWVDICAPGTYILSTLPNQTYGYYSGTSMASPFVAGLAALVMIKYPHFSNEEVRQRIKNTALNIYDKNPAFLSGQLGSGRINAHRALGNIVVEIDYPKDGAEVSKKMVIKGSADVENFKSYKLEYGVGSNPNIWMPIGSVHTEPIEGEIMEEWDATDLFGEYSLRLEVVDTSGETYVAQNEIKISTSSDVDLVSDPLPGPNPFNPEAHNNLKIYYELGTVPAGGADIDIRIYDLTGKMIWRKNKYSAGPGPVTDVYWDGFNVFGKRIGNGVYPFFLVQNGKIVGRNKIAVVR